MKHKQVFKDAAWFDCVIQINHTGSLFKNKIWILLEDAI